MAKVDGDQPMDMTISIPVLMSYLAEQVSLSVNIDIDSREVAVKSKLDAGKGIYEERFCIFRSQPFKFFKLYLLHALQIKI